MTKFNYIFASLLLISFNAHSSEYIIKTTSGITSGYLKKGVISWDDIPYAKPPVKDLRWKAPKKLDISAKNNIISPKDNNFCIQEPSGLGGSNGDSFFQVQKIVYIWM